MIIMLIAVLEGCKKDTDKVQIPETFGEMNCDYNGKSWTAEVVGAGISNRHDTIEVLNFNRYNGNVRSEFMWLTNIKKTLVQQNIYRGDYLSKDKVYAYYSTTNIEFDAGCDDYEVWEADSVNNRIQITEEKNDYAEIWGKFSVTFIKIRSCDGSPYPDTVRIRNAVFHIREIEQQ